MVVPKLNGLVELTSFLVDACFSICVSIITTTEDKETTQKERGVNAIVLETGDLEHLYKYMFDYHAGLFENKVWTNGAKLT